MHTYVLLLAVVVLLKWQRRAMQRQLFRFSELVCSPYSIYGHTDIYSPLYMVVYNPDVIDL